MGSLRIIQAQLQKCHLKRYMKLKKNIFFTGRREWRIWMPCKETIGRNPKYFYGSGGQKLNKMHKRISVVCLSVTRSQSEESKKGTFEGPVLFHWHPWSLGSGGCSRFVYGDTEILETCKVWKFYNTSANLVCI